MNRLPTVQSEAGTELRPDARCRKESAESGQTEQRQRLKSSTGFRMVSAWGKELPLKDGWTMLFPSGKDR